MRKWKYYIRSTGVGPEELLEMKWEIDRERYMSIRKYLIKYKGMTEDYCSKSKTRYIAGKNGILIYRKEIDTCH